MANVFLPLFLVYITALATTTNATRNGLFGRGGSVKRRLLDLPEEKLSMDPNNIAQRWRELYGENHWNGLLNPLDPDLQKHLINYAALCETTYESFFPDPKSPTVDCKYSMQNYFAEAGLVLGNPFKYTIVKYLYASGRAMPKGDTSSKDSSWIGYIAVATDEGKQTLGRRDIVVVWRGTKGNAEWAKDFDVPLVPAKAIVGKISNKAWVHQGFLRIYTSRTSDPKTNNTGPREQVVSALQILLQRWRDEEVSITVTGHSMGAAIAIICAADIVANGHNMLPNNKTFPVAMFNYGGPRVGDKNFKQAIASLPDLRVLRVVNKDDFVTKVPPAFIYTHVGDSLTVNNVISPHLVLAQDPGSVHMVEPGYLHPLAIANGAKNLRSLACVNKLSGSLDPRYKVPKFWWKAAVKPLVQRQDGSWVLKPNLTGS